MRRWRSACPSRIAQPARLGAERPAWPGGAVLLARARLRWRGQAGAGRAGRRAAHRRHRPHRRPPAALRNGQRHERRGGARRRRSGAARPGASRARRRGAEGSLLVGDGVPLARHARRRAGSGPVDPGAAVVAEVAAAPAAVGFGAALKQGWQRDPPRARPERHEQASARLGGSGGRGDRGRVRDRAAVAVALRSGAEREIVRDGEGAVRPTRARRDRPARARVVVAGGGEIAIPWAVTLPAGLGAAARRRPALRGSFRAVRPRAGRAQRPRRQRAGSRRPGTAAAADSGSTSSSGAAGNASACLRGCATSFPGATRSAHGPRAARRHARARAPTGCASSRSHRRARTRRGRSRFRIR